MKTLWDIVLGGKTILADACVMPLAADYGLITPLVPLCM